MYFNIDNNKYTSPVNIYDIFKECVEERASSELSCCVSRYTTSCPPSASRFAMVHSAAAVGIRRTEVGCRSIPLLRPRHASPHTTDSLAAVPTSAHPSAQT